MTSSTQSLLETYQARGLVVARDMFDATEVETLRRESKRIWDGLERRDAFNLRIGLRKNANNDDVLERLDPVIDLSDIFSAVNTDERMVRLAQLLLGEPVTAMKEKLIFKSPGTSGYGMHRDEAYFGSSGASGKEMLTIAIALDRAYAENGAMIFYPSLCHEALPAPPEEPRDIDPDVLDNTLAVQPELNPGDVVAFSGLIPHGSQINRSNDHRLSYLVTYMPARLSNGRNDYYHARLLELIEQRSKYLSGEFYFR
jgi:ectoine hydroxylase-related dioxygenase (phytanoyl-CoA dioxygenase family)